MNRDGLHFNDIQASDRAVVVDEMFELFAKLKQQGLTILLVEQNVQQALKISDRAYILDQGEIVFYDTAQNLLNNDEIQQKYCAV